MNIKDEMLQLLQQRVSVTSLMAPAPNANILESVFKVAIRAADHGKLQPWRFLIIEGSELSRLGDIFVEAAKRANPNVSPSVLERFKSMPLRAPMIIVAIARCQDHPKVPKQEQIVSCGAAVQNMLNAFFLLGYGSVWRSGEMAYDSYVLQRLGITENEEILGFIYVGTPAKEPAPAPATDPQQFFASWHAE